MRWLCRMGWHRLRLKDEIYHYRWYVCTRCGLVKLR